MGICLTLSQLKWTTSCALRTFKKTRTKNRYPSIHISINQTTVLDY
uniref:Uncharacterized protein n=1 Tax=Anguilla anguilla TaxID=7936 RepID=A0A0E9RF15_ANGAN